MNETESAIIRIVKDKYILIEKEKRQSLWTAPIIPRNIKKQMQT